MPKRIKSLNYQLMICLMQKHHEQLEIDISKDRLNINDINFKNIIKEIIDNKESIDYERIIKNFILFADKHSLFTFYIDNEDKDNKKFVFEMLPEGYKYQYLGYKRWEYVQHGQIKFVTWILAFTGLLQVKGIENFFGNLFKSIADFFSCIF